MADERDDWAALARHLENQLQQARRKVASWQLKVELLEVGLERARERERGPHGRRQSA